MKCWIYIDDERTPMYAGTGYTRFCAKDYDEAIQIIETSLNTFNQIVLDFDHDLGPGRTGYDIAKYVVENQLPTDKIFYTIHSANPVGYFNIQQLLNHYGYKEWKFNVGDC